jgi:hypothetical protein
VSNCAPRTSVGSQFVFSLNGTRATREIHREFWLANLKGSYACDLSDHVRVWRDATAVGLKQGVDWIQVAQVTVLCRIIVNMLMNLLVT